MKTNISPLRLFVISKQFVLTTRTTLNIHIESTHFHVRTKITIPTAKKHTYTRVHSHINVKNLARVLLSFERKNYCKKFDG